MKLSVRDMFHRGHPVAAPVTLPAAVERREGPGACVDCGQELSPILVELGSLRCHECRYGESDHPGAA